MPEVVIKYKNRETLEMLRGLAKYLDYVISSPKGKEDKPASKHAVISFKGVPVIPGNPGIDTKDVKEIFSGKNIDAKQVRKSVWRKK